MSELNELYQELILDHNKNPRNFHELKDATHTLEGFNPLCGDKLKLYLNIDSGLIKDIGFIGSGCAISTASSSLMTDALKGKSVEEAKNLFQHFVDSVTGEDDTHLDELDKLAALTGVKEFPMRVKCATLSWHTLKSILEEKNDPVTTE